MTHRHRFFGLHHLLALIVLAILYVLCTAGGAHAADATLSWTFDLHNTDGSVIPAPPAAGSLTTTAIDYGTCTGTGATRSFGTKAGTMTVAYPATSLVVSMVVVQEYCFRGFVTNTFNVSSALTAVVWKANPPPTPNPPNITLTSIDTTIYRQRDRVNGFDLVPFATAAIGLKCDPCCESNGLYVVDRNQVTKNTPFDTLPLKVYAKCG